MCSKSTRANEGFVAAADRLVFAGMEWEAASRYCEGISAHHFSTRMCWW